MRYMIARIISGAQTGADRGGVEAAWDLGLSTGGWAPAGWRAEDGVIPERYRVGMTQSSSPAYPMRTRQNVESSDGTLILSLGQLTMDSGSMLTSRLARTNRKPTIHFQLGEFDGYLTEFAEQRMLDWLLDHKISTLNVAGSRESREPGIQAAVRACLVRILGKVSP